MRGRRIEWPLSSGTQAILVPNATARGGLRPVAVAGGPGGVSSGLQLWLKADGNLWQDTGGTTPATADGTAVARWDDASSGANNATQATGANMPILKTGAVGGKPVLRFDGTNSFMSTALTSFLQPVTIFSVSQGTSVVTQNTWTGSTVDGGLQYRHGGVQEILAQGVASLGHGNFGLVANTWYVHTVTFDAGGAINFYINGASDGSTSTAQALTNGGTVVIGESGRGNERLAGDIAELVIYNRVLTGAELTSVTSYLQGKYGI